MDGTWQPSLRLGRVCAVSEHALYPRALYPSVGFLCVCAVSERMCVRCIRAYVCALYSSVRSNKSVDGATSRRQPETC